jgi:hypothetical protein
MRCFIHLLVWIRWSWYNAEVRKLTEKLTQDATVGHPFITFKSRALAGQRECVLVFFAWHWEYCIVHTNEGRVLVWCLMTICWFRTYVRIRIISSKENLHPSTQLIQVVESGADSTSGNMNLSSSGQTLLGAL